MTNQSLRRNWFVRLFASLKLTLVLLAVFAVAIATATFLEAHYGSEGARALVYNARWFEILLGVLALNLVVSLLANMPYLRAQTGFVITHIAFVIVLVSSGITRFFGYEGRMHIREGSSSDYLMSSRDYVQLSMGSQTASFPVRLYRAGAVSVHDTVHLPTGALRVSVEEYWPHFEMRMEEGAGGRPLIAFTTGRQRGKLGIGESFRDSGVTVRFLAAKNEKSHRASAYGDLVITIGGQRHRVPVPLTPQPASRIGDYRFRITQLFPDFHLGGTPSPLDPMNNPAVRVEIEGPDGGKEERLLFAFYPKFDQMHAGGRKAFSKISLKYQYVRNLDLFLNRDGKLSGRADFDLHVARGTNRDGASDAGAHEVFIVEPGTTLRAGEFSFVLRELWASAVERPALSDNEDAPPAVRVRVEDAAGNTARAVVPKWNKGVPLHVGDANVTLAFGPVRIPLPYRIQLDDFVLSTYPGSDNPASFESRVRIFDEDRHVVGRPVRIYMNHPLTYRGFKHFQSSYDRDRHGTILSVTHDPGKWPTYDGYFLVGLGFLVTLTRGLVWNRTPNL